MRMMAAILWLALALEISAAQPVAAAGNESGVTFMPAQKLLPELAKPSGRDRGITLNSLLSARGYSAVLVRRTRAGSAELHRTVSDVWYVIDGGGTLVTNGALVGARETEPGELRGERIAGGTARRIATGDFIAIPAGIPHWVSAIAGARLVYLVVKVKAPTRSK